MKCGSTFGMGQKSRFAGDNVMIGTKIQKGRNTLCIIRMVI